MPRLRNDNNADDKARILNDAADFQYLSFLVVVNFNVKVILLGSKECC